MVVGEGGGGRGGGGRQGGKGLVPERCQDMNDYKQRELTRWQGGSLLTEHGTYHKREGCGWGLRVATERGDRVRVRREPADPHILSRGRVSR